MKNLLMLAMQVFICVNFYAQQHARHYNVISGDFERTGIKKNFALVYGNQFRSGYQYKDISQTNSHTDFHVYEHNSDLNCYTVDQNNPWWQAAYTSYDAEKIHRRVVVGDFDRDGYKDDVAALFNYSGARTRIHVWKSSGGTFSYQGNSGWWDSGSGNYEATAVTGRVIVGDFDRDGFDDDIAAFYMYPNSRTRIHVWKSTGNGFAYQGNSGWWDSGSGQYNAENIEGRIVVGDFDRDGYNDDIAAFYGYSGSRTRIHVWKSTGNGFAYQGNSGWWDSGSGQYNASEITYKVVSGDFDRDGYKDDIAGIFEYSNGNSNIHVWKSTGSGMLYQGNDGWISNVKIGGRDVMGVASGDFDDDGYDDIIALAVDVTSESKPLDRPQFEDPHIFISYGDQFELKVGTCSGTLKGMSSSKKDISSGMDCKLYPNPAKDFIQVKFNSDELLCLTIFNSYGQLVLKTDVNSFDKVNVSSLSQGLYTVRVSSSNKELNSVHKLIIQK